MAIDFCGEIELSVQCFPVENSLNSAFQHVQNHVYDTFTRNEDALFHSLNTDICCGIISDYFRIISEKVGNCLDLVE